MMTVCYASTRTATENEGEHVDDMERNVEVQRLAADLFDAAGAMRRDGEAIARTEGQTQARWQVMWIAATGRMSVSSIARRLGLARQSVQRVADAVVKDGLATFEANPDHSRSPLLVLTDEGAAILGRLDEAAAQRNVELANELGDDELRRLRTLLDRVRQALDARSS
jgi:DNA-binding MarR family transcriptional regulator